MSHTPPTESRHRKLVKDAAENQDNKTPSSKPKDAWDKAGVIAQYLSGVVIAAVGGYFTYTNNWAQQAASASAARAQIEVSNRQQTSTYVNQLVSQTNASARADLIGAIDLSLRPEDAIPIGLRFAHPDQDPRVISQSITVLNRMMEPGQLVLRQVQKGGAMPDSEIAGAILGEKIHVKVRVSQIDDFGFLYFSVAGQKEPHKQIAGPFLFGQTSEWLDITERLVPQSENLLLFKIANGPHGGSSGRLEISVGTQQYDSRLVALKACPCNADAFFILAHLVVYNDKGTDGSIGLTVGEPETYPWPGKTIKH